MQEPIEPTESLEDSKDVEVQDGELVFDHVNFKYDVKSLYVMSPLSISYIRSIKLNIVLLPEPEGPTNALT
jgi:hypothetical protein